MASLTDAGARAATAELKARIGRRFRKMPAANGAVGVPQRLVVYEVSVDSVETWADRHRRKTPPTPHRPDPDLARIILERDASYMLDPTWIRRRNNHSEGWAAQPGWRRHVDAMAIGLWRKVAGEVDGFEVKVSRGDLRKELSDPRKAGAGARFCNRWWLVVPDLSIVEGFELPREWGVLVARGQGLGVHRQAAELDPDPWTGQFTASLLCSALTQAVPNNPRPRLLLKAIADGRDADALTRLIRLAGYPEDVTGGQAVNCHLVNYGSVHDPHEWTYDGVPLVCEGYR